MATGLPVLPPTALGTPGAGREGGFKAPDIIDGTISVISSAAIFFTSLTSLYLFTYTQPPPATTAALTPNEAKARTLISLCIFLWRVGVVSWCYGEWGVFESYGLTRSNLCGSFYECF